MPISQKYKCIFIHIPKTAGTSIEHALEMHGDKDFIGIKPYINQKQDYDSFFGGGLQHCTVSQLAKMIDNFDDYFKFSFVRNPFDRAVSAVSFLGGGLKNCHKPLTKERFEEFIKKGIPNTGHFISQYDFLSSGERALVDFVGKYENLERDFGFVCDKLGVNKTLEHRMKSTHAPYWSYYSQETLEIVAEKYAKDIEHFGYEFGE
jgi:hypothetical protein